VDGSVLEAQPPAEVGALLKPVTAAERIDSLDVLRGVALLGILLMNILTFGLHFGAYFNPNVDGGATGLNLAAFLVQYIFWDGKMRALFSLCFGAGIILLTTRGEKRGAGIAVADIYYRRMLWLLLFGLAHAYLIWYGDILYPYALCGLVLFPFRKLSPKALLIIAGVMCILLTGASIGQGFMLRETKAKAAEAETARKAGKKLTAEQEKAEKDWKDTLKYMNPPPEEVKKEYDAYRGTYASAFKQRAEITTRWHSKPFYTPGLWDMFAMMFIGMAFMKLDLLSASKSTAFYAKMAAIGLAVGLPINSFAAWQSVQVNFEPLSIPFVFSTYQIGRVSVSLAYLAIIMLVCKAGLLRFLTARLASVGQAAFSNYISHSVICSLIFYGYGFGLIGKLERHQLYFIVPAIWLFNLIATPIWLRHYRFGPIEWCWRSLTYWQRQPMRILKETSIENQQPEITPQPT